MNIVTKSRSFDAQAKRVYGMRSAAHYTVLEANFLTRGLWAGDHRHAILVPRIDEAVAALAVGKWYLGRATGDIGGLAKPSGAEDDFRRAAEAFEDATRIADAAIAGRPEERGDFYRPQPRPGTEIAAVGEVPIVPSIGPIVVLQGSSRAMGEQYTRQVLEIFGSFVFSAYASRGLTPEHIKSIDRWTGELRAHAPEIIEFAEGMSLGARSCGVALSHHEALAMWTGIEPPDRKIRGMQSLAYFGVVEDIPDPCSGACGWGGATIDGELYLGASTDHDCTFQATVVAFPDDGNAFIYTPFSVNGYTTFVGEAWFAGHPGINSKGLAYVQHGAGCEGSTISDGWDYGIRRGASTFNILRNRDNARDALAAELAFPLGDGANILGTAGGFYADKSFGYVIESREPRHGPVIREKTYDKTGHALDVLYANNNNIDPRSGTHFCPPREGYRHELEAGWFTLEEPDGYDDFGVVTRRMLAKSSEGRNRYLHRRLTEAHGSIDLDTMTRIYQQGPRFPEKPWHEIEADWKKGERFESSSAHRGNAFVAVASPRTDGTGIYKGCVGPITHRSVPPHKAGHGYIYHDETNELWEITLPDTPGEMLRRAFDAAEARLERAEATLPESGAERPADLDVLLAKSRQQLQAGRAASQGAAEDVAKSARALRAATRAQVRAAQATSAATRGRIRGS